jgi:hypothetical protein
VSGPPRCFAIEMIAFFRQYPNKNDGLPGPLAFSALSLDSRTGRFS